MTVVGVAPHSRSAIAPELCQPKPVTTLLRQRSFTFATIKFRKAGHEAALRLHGCAVAFHCRAQRDTGDENSGGGGSGIGAFGGAGGSPDGGGKRHRSDDTKAPDQTKKKADDKAYQEALKRIPEPKEKFDPWGVTKKPAQ